MVLAQAEVDVLNQEAALLNKMDHPVLNLAEQTTNVFRSLAAGDYASFPASMQSSM